MKTSKIQKSASSNSHSSKPFFNKSGEGSFFSQTKESEKPFFSPYPIQTKLTLGQPNDKYEQEADNMAEKVVQRLDSPKPTSPIQTKGEAFKQQEKLQKKEQDGEEMEVMRKPVFESNGKQPEDPIQTKTDNNSNIGLRRLENKLNSTKGNGSSLPENTRSSMESAFGADFSGVRVYTDSSAVQMNKDIGAKAFTHGSDVYFNKGNYNSNSFEGKKLLAHELTHVVQQNHKIIQPYRDKTIKKTKKKATHFGELDTRTLKEQEFKNKKTQPWIKTITIIFNTVITDSNGLKIPKGTAKAKYYQNKAKKSPVTIPITGGSDKLGQTRPKDNFWVHRIEGVGFNDSTILGPDGTGFSGIGQENRYSKSYTSSMHYAIFFDGGRALHEGSLTESSHGCVHCGGNKDLLQQINYHSVAGATKVKVFFDGEAYNEFIK